MAETDGPAKSRLSGSFKYPPRERVNEALSLPGSALRATERSKVTLSLLSYSPRALSFDSATPQKSSVSCATLSAQEVYAPVTFSVERLQKLHEHC